MTIPSHRSSPASLSDEALVVHIRDAITAAQRRPGAAGAVKALIFAVAAEYRMEFLAGSTLPVAEIVDIAERGGDAIAQRTLDVVAGGLS
jgi:hypothetical protein